MIFNINIKLVRPVTSKRDNQLAKLDFNMIQYINVFKESQSKWDLVRHESVK